MLSSVQVETFLVAHLLVQAEGKDNYGGERVSLEVA